MHPTEPPRLATTLLSFEQGALIFFLFLHENIFCGYLLEVPRLEMCQYDTDAPAQGHPQPHAGILQKMKLKKGTNQSFF